MNAPATDRIALSLAGEQVELLADRALFWPRERTLFIADPHFGKGVTFRRSGFAVPDDTEAELARLSRLLEQTGARLLVILGDLLHARAGSTEPLFAALVRWRSMHAALDLLLVRGNHDRHAGDPPARLAIRLVNAPSELGPFACVHEPVERPGRHVLAGHVHPSFVLRDRNGTSLRSPCFWLRPALTILPAFGTFTGGEPVKPGPADSILVVGSGQIIRVVTPQP